jgi:hypothetical protein
MDATNLQRPSQWRWDRFDPKKTTTMKWASRNCVGADRAMESSHRLMQRQVLTEVKSAEHLIQSELHQLIYEAANITGISYCCKQTQQTLPCLNRKDLRQSWVQDGSEENMKRLAWIFYYYGTEVHKIGKSCLTHGEWVERKVMKALNIVYVHLVDIPVGQRTCLHQLYSKKFNDFRTNVMRQSPSLQHTSRITKEQPKVPGMFKKNFKRAKATFFMTKKVNESTAWQKVCRPYMASAWCEGLF